MSKKSSGKPFRADSSIPATLSLDKDTKLLNDNKYRTYGSFIYKGTDIDHEIGTINIALKPLITKPLNVHIRIVNIMNNTVIAAKTVSIVKSAPIIVTLDEITNLPTEISILELQAIKDTEDSRINLTTWQLLG